MRDCVVMRELDTASPVVWPAWCYTAENQDLDRSDKKTGMTTVDGVVKAERLSPSSSGGPVCDTGSSRSGTPSSSCTPPRQGGSPSQALPLSRNYSDFMRSLAAKYNNNNSTPNDFLSGRNGFSSLKPGTSPPFPGALPPPSASPAAKSSESGKTESQSMLGFLPVPPMFPPVVDLNATQALLNMVRTHQQLESYLKGTKRDNGNAPLDLSATAPPPKKQKKTLSEALYGSDVIPLLKSSKRGAGGGMNQAKRQAAAKAAACVSACQEKPCTPDSQTVNHWTVEDVAGFVASVEMCAEYAQNFRDQRIDGSALALLTEEHLTTTLSMKLGPALKLRSLLSSKLGQCSVCLHCSHCHSTPEK